MEENVKFWKQLMILIVIGCISISMVSIGYGYWTTQMQIQGSAILSASYEVEINSNHDNKKIGNGEDEEGIFDEEGNFFNLPKMEINPPHPMAEEGENETEGLLEDQESTIQDNQDNVELIFPKEQTEGETESLEQEEALIHQLEDAEQGQNQNETERPEQTPEQIEAQN